MRALASFRIYAEYGQGVVPSDVFWCGADPGWAYGLYFGILATFTTGTPSILLQGGFTPEATMRVLEQERVTNFAAAPTVYRALRSSGLRPSAPLALRCLSSAGEPLTPEVNSWAEELLGLTVYDHYGQTEAGMLINNHHHPDVRRPVVPGSMGQAMPGWRAVILDAELDQEVPTDTFGRVAMVVADSPLCWFKGYGADAANRGDKFTADGRYYLTGDTASLDKDGYFRFSARDDDVIIMAGYRIGPFEVESSLATHPSVAESAVIAVPDEVRGEVIEAYVARAGARHPELGEDALRRARLSAPGAFHRKHAQDTERQDPAVRAEAAPPERAGTEGVSSPEQPDKSVIEAVRGRRSVRKFLPREVPRDVVSAILEAASRAPSGTNIQPWLIHVVTGAARERLIEAVMPVAEAGELSLEYAYLPEQMKEPYLSRRRAVGYALYEKYQIERTDYPARKAAMLRNFEFFGAPVGIFFTMERDMALGAWLDCGMFMQNVMVLARGYGLETCPQQAWCDVGAAVHAGLGIPDHHLILSGMALGYADWSANENTLVTERIGVDEFTTWHS
jgi:nitroreductase